MPADDASAEEGMREYRKRHPSGWLKLTRFPTLPYLIDALLGHPPSREFSKADLQRMSGVSGNSVRKYLPTLVDLGIVEEIEAGGYPRFSFNERNRISQKIIELNNTVIQVESGEFDSNLPQPELSPQERRKRRISIEVDYGDGDRVGPESMNHPTLAAD